MSLTAGLSQEGRKVFIVKAPILIFSSMPYAQVHYPFENKERFESTHPAHFISEGIDQTRGWFYTLLVLSTHLFGKAPWQNVIVTGLVLAA
jgi:isoleucyl-tRNA synthetase